MTARIYPYVAVLLVGLVFGGVASWQVQTWRLGTEVAQVQTREAEGKANRAEAARADETQTAQLESKHAKDTIYNSDRLASLKTGIAVDVRSELERAHRLQLNADGRAATYRAQAEADATARSALADKASALDTSLAEGRVVATELGGALKQRDAEVAALCDQVNIERGLNGNASDQACRDEH